MKDRPIKETICLFDVDGTLSPARKHASAEMIKVLSELRKKCAIGFVSLLLPLAMPTPAIARSKSPDKSTFPTYGS